MRRMTTGLVLALALGFSGTARSQAAHDDWDIVEDPARDAIRAAVAYDSGVVLQVQCMAGELDTVLWGPPVEILAASDIAALSAGTGLAGSVWTATQDKKQYRTSFRMPRRLMRGGTLALGVHGGNTGAPVVSLELPPSSQGLQRVLSACGLPLQDARDDMLGLGDLLIAAPNFQPPRAAMTHHDRMAASLSCIVEDGRPTACQVDRQSPQDSRATRALIRAVERMRLRLRDVEAAEGRLFEIEVTSVKLP